MVLNDWMPTGNFLLLMSIMIASPLNVLFPLYVHFSAKIMQTSAMKACFQIVECSFSSVKIRFCWDICKSQVLILLNTREGLNGEDVE